MKRSLLAVMLVAMSPTIAKAAPTYDYCDCINTDGDLSDWTVYGDRRVNVDGGSRLLADPLSDPFPTLSECYQYMSTLKVCPSRPTGR